MTDVLLYQTDDGGDLTAVNGQIEMSGGLATSVYLCLFGGNEQDSGGDDTRLQWWGNIGEIPDQQYRSETQYLLRSIPAIPANLTRVQRAAERDLQSLVSVGAATAVSVSVSMPGLNRIAIIVGVDAVDEPPVTLMYTSNWEYDIA